MMTIWRTCWTMCDDNFFWHGDCIGRRLARLVVRDMKLYGEARSCKARHETCKATKLKYI